jgi:hypothetical protein
MGEWGYRTRIIPLLSSMKPGISHRQVVCTSRDFTKSACLRSEDVTSEHKLNLKMVTYNILQCVRKF